MFIYHDPEEEVPEQEIQVQLPDFSTPAFGQWITILESNFNRRPTTINLSWKQSHQKIISVSFRDSITAPQSKKRKAMIQSRQEIDNHLFPRDRDGNIFPSLQIWK